MKCSYCQQEKEVTREILDWKTIAWYCHECEEKHRDVVNRKIMDDLEALRPKLDAGLRYLRDK